MVEGYHGHDFSVENQAAAIAFLDRFNGQPVHNELPSTGSSTIERFRSHGRDKSPSTIRRAVRFSTKFATITGRTGKQPIRTVAALYRGAGYAGVGQWRVAPYAGSDAVPSTIQWEASGSSTEDGITIDKYLLHHSGGLQMPLLHIHRTGDANKRTLLWVGEIGKARASDWQRLRQYVDDGYDVVSFDPRGLGETRMRYTAVSVDDPSLAMADFDRAYANPLSSVLGDYVYNAILTGRPYLLQLIEDVEIAARFSRAHLNAARLSVAGDGDAFTLAHWAAKVLPDLELVAGPDSRVLDWAQLVEQQQETWPIQYVIPGGAYLQ